MTSVHPDRGDLHGYLRGSLTPVRRAGVRDHLDACRPCWDRWNRHRWDAARQHPLYDELAAFLGSAFQPGLDSSRALADEWDCADPHTPTETAAFFRASTSYLYNLVIWEASGHRPRYLDAALPALAASRISTVLDIGSGIGSDAIALTRHDYAVTTCDHDSPSTRFARRRHGGEIAWIDPERLGPAHAADAIWIVDTLDHLPDPDTTLGPLLPHARIVITEDLREDRGHGRQRFHHRRPFSDTSRMLARHGLTPSAHGPIMAWTRERVPALPAADLPASTRRSHS